MNDSPIVSARAYVRRIKNENKKKYARAFLEYILSGGTEPDKGELGEMGAQAVRIQLRQLLPEAKP